MDYLEIKTENTYHVALLIEWLFDEVMSAGGDGDGIWYSKNFNVNDIAAFIDTNKLAPRHFKREDKINEVYYGHNQEGLLITNNKEDFDNRPIWQQVSLVY